IAALTAIRFVGALAVIPLFAYWLICHARQCTPLRCAATGVAFGGIAALGVLADMLVKWKATGEPLAAFLVRSAWDVTSLRGFARILRLDQLFVSAEYLPLLGLPAAVIAIGLATGVVLVRERV